MDSTKKLTPEAATQQLFNMTRGAPLNQSSDPKVINALISQGADVNVRDYFGFTPLISAAMYGDTGMAEALISAPGILVNHAGLVGKTALMFAVEYSRVSIVEILLKAPGININQFDSHCTDNTTALMQAASRNHVACMILLLAAEGININLKNTRGETALSQAISKGNFEAVQALLQAKNIDTYGARELVEQSAHVKIFKLLEVHPKKALTAPSPKAGLTYSYNSQSLPEYFPSSPPVDSSLEGYKPKNKLNGRHFQ